MGKFQEFKKKRDDANKKRVKTLPAVLVTHGRHSLTAVELAEKLKKVMPKGWKYTLSVSNHSTLYVTIRSAPNDLLADLRGKVSYDGYPLLSEEYCDVNRHSLGSGGCEWSKKNQEIFQKIYAVMNDGNHDNCALS